MNTNLLTKLKKFPLQKRLNPEPQIRLVPGLHCSKEKFASANGRQNLILTTESYSAQ